MPELKRLRISSIDSIEVDRDLLDVIADDERLMPHLHLSLQSGDDLILKRMKRRHSRADAIEFCAQVRRLRPDIALGADIIAGFPTETEEMFARSHGSGGGVRPHLPARVSLFTASGHAGGANAAGRGRRDQAARQAVARDGERPRCEGGWRRRSARRARFLIESATQGRTEHFIPVAICG